MFMIEMSVGVMKRAGLTKPVSDQVEWKSVCMCICLSVPASVSMYV